MHKYYDFSKIYEAEQSGTPLKPEEMGLATNLNETEAKLEDFEAIKNDGYQIEVMLNQEDMNNLIKDGVFTTNEAKWKKSDDQTDIKDIKSLVINVGDHQITQGNDAIVFKIDTATANRIVDGIKDGGKVTESISSISPKIINAITINFIKSNEVTSGSTTQVKPASQEQVEAGAVTPEAVSGTVETTPNESIAPKKIMSFDQFITEGKGENWIADVIKDVKKGALKKELGGEKVTRAKISKKEAELAKKDKDKEKPGLQLGAKDAKTHKRNILALNLLKAQKGKK